MILGHDLLCCGGGSWVQCVVVGHGGNGGFALSLSHGGFFKVFSFFFFQWCWWIVWVFFFWRWLVIVMVVVVAGGVGLL